MKMALMTWPMITAAVLFGALIGPVQSIVDTVPPRIINCPQDIYRTVPLGTEGFTPVYWSHPKAVDNSGETSVLFNFSPGTAFPLGRFPHPVTYTYSDPAGNEATCKFYITITEARFNCTVERIHLEDPPSSPSPQTITSPNYPMEYPSNSNCQWEVWRSVSDSSLTNGILLKIQEVQLHASDVLIVKGTDTEEAVTYSGRVPPRMLLYQGEELSISLQTGNRGLARLKGIYLEVEVQTSDGNSFCLDGYQCSKTSICVPEQYLCDHIVDCPLADDEQNCTVLCQESITSLPFHMTFDPSEVIHGNPHPFIASEAYLEWCFTSSVGHQIMLDFPPSGNDYLLMQSLDDAFGQDMVLLRRHTLAHSLSFNGSSLVIRLYPALEGTQTAFSINVKERQHEGYCKTGYQCMDSHFCVDRKNDCDGVMDCPQGDDEKDCERRCPKVCNCKASWGSLNITYCNVTWTAELSKSAPAITTKLDIGLKNLGSVKAGYFEGLTNLRDLLVTSSNVTYLESGVFRGLENLQYLRLPNNSLTRLPNDIFAEVPNLVELELRDNKLVELERNVFQQQRKLKKLFLHGNQLTSLPSGIFSTLGQLQYLFIQKNNLTELPADIFKGLVKLRNLKLMSNKLSSFPPGLFQELVDLEEIDVSTNGIAELAGKTLHGLYKLKKISLQDNNLTHFEDGFFSNFTHLEGIYSRNNSIDVIQPALFRGLVNLTCIDLKNNQIREMPHDSLLGLAKLSQLYLSGNQLTSLDPNLLEGHTHLDKLELQFNALTSLQPGHFQDQGKLTSLYLSSNNLSKLKRGTFIGLGSVYDLLLDSNQIKEVEPGTFKGLRTLGTLDLRYNQITELKKGVFEGMLNLRHLYLSGNPLRRVDSAVFDACPHLKVVKTDNHALYCLLNCSMIVCDFNAQPFPPYFTCDRRLLTQDIMKAFIWLQVIFAISGNLVVLLWRGRQLKGRKKKSQTLMILSLAASDLLMGLYLLIIASADLHFGQDFFLQMAEWRASFTCKFAGVVGLVSSEASVFLVTLISIDRFLGVVFPFSPFRPSTRATVRILLGLWILALGVSITASVLSAANADFYELSNVCFGLPLSTKPTNVTSTRTMSESSMGNVMVETVHASGNKPAWLFPIVIFLGVNLLSFIIVFICYLAIFISAKLSSRKSARPADKSEEMRLAIKMGLIVGTDFCCWVPVIIMGILSQSGIVAIEPTMYAWVVIFILPINSSINPWLYTLSTTLPTFWKNLSQRRGSSIDTGSTSASLGLRAKLAGYSRGREKRSSSSALHSLGNGPGSG